MLRALIPKKELQLLPFPLLAQIAMAAARDVDAGEDKSALLEALFDAMRRQRW
jgi:hypothetical protein